MIPTVYRLRYQWPSRDEDGEVYRDLDDKPEWNAPVTRYYWSKKALDRKIHTILNPEDASVTYDQAEPHPGRVLSVDSAEVGDWNRLVWEAE